MERAKQREPPIVKKEEKKGKIQGDDNAPYIRKKKRKWGRLNNNQKTFKTKEKNTSDANHQTT